MHAITAIFCLTNLVGGQPDGATETMRYVRPSGKGYTLESLIVTKKVKGGSVYVSTTKRPGVQMQLTITSDAKGRIKSAETVLTRKSAKKSITAQAAFRKGVAVVRYGETQKSVRITFEGHARVATTAPDWSDILFLMRQCDFDKKGVQKFVGVWFHPSRKPFKLTFQVERLGEGKITVGKRSIKLGRFRVQLRSGNYTVWANAKGRVIRLAPAKRPKSAVILEGYEKATAELK